MSDDEVACSRCCQRYPADSPFCTTCGLAADVASGAQTPDEESAKRERVDEVVPRERRTLPRPSRRATVIGAAFAVTVALGVGAVVLAPWDGAAAVGSNKTSTTRTNAPVAAPTTTSSTTATTVPTTTAPPPPTTIPTPATTIPAAPTALAAPQDIATTLVLLDGIAGVDGTWVTGKPCQGLHGATDIKPAAVATVKDAKGTLLSSAPLGAGTVAPLKPGSSVTTCVFSFTFRAVPATTSYVFAVANRGRITVSAAGMQAAGWTLALRLS